VGGVTTLRLPYKAKGFRAGSVTASSSALWGLFRSWVPSYLGHHAQAEYDRQGATHEQVQDRCCHCLCWRCLVRRRHVNPGSFHPRRCVHPRRRLPAHQAGSQEGPGVPGKGRDSGSTCRGVRGRYDCRVVPRLC
jgi:hypothetical protein